MKDARERSERIDLHLAHAQACRHPSAVIEDPHDRLRREEDIHTTLAGLLARLDAIQDEQAIRNIVRAVDSIATRVDRLENSRKGVISVGGRER